MSKDSFICRLGLILIAMACLCLVLSGCSSTKLTYKASGTAAQAEIEYRDEKGQLTKQTVSLPWEKTVSIGDKFSFQVNVTNTTNSGTVICAVLMNSKEMGPTTGVTYARCTGNVSKQGSSTTWDFHGEYDQPKVAQAPTATPLKTVPTLSPTRTVAPTRAVTATSPPAGATATRAPLASPSATPPRSPCSTDPSGTGIAWTIVSQLADGRKFFSDNCIMLESSYIAAGGVPTRTISAQTVESLLARKTTHEFGFNDLKSTGVAGNYQAPQNILLNKRYISYLKSLPTSSRFRFRAEGPLDPVLVADGTKIIGIVMPMESK